MNAITRRLATAALTAGITAAAAATATPAHAWTGCEGDCVNAVTITQTLATKATPKLKFTTSVPTKVIVTFKQVGGGTAGAVSSSSSSFVTSHVLDAGPILTQGKGYIASIKATDESGKSFTDQVSLTALSRTVTLTVTKVTITEDSDIGAGELRAGVRVGTTVATIFGERSISATKTLTPNKVVVAKNVAGNGKVAVEIQDNDADLGEFCTTGTAFGFTSGSNKCLDWTTGSAALTLPTTKGANSGSFSFSASGRLAFKVWGTYSVTVG